VKGPGATASNTFNVRIVPDIGKPLSGLQLLFDFGGLILIIRIILPKVNIAFRFDLRTFQPRILPITNLMVLRRNHFISVNHSLSLYTVKILECLDFCLFLETLFSVDDMSFVDLKLWGIFAHIHDGLWQIMQK
jgi:hypothetical protein